MEDGTENVFQVEWDVIGRDVDLKIITFPDDEYVQNLYGNQVMYLMEFGKDAAEREELNMRYVPYFYGCGYRTKVISKTIEKLEGELESEEEEFKFVTFYIFQEHMDNNI